MVSVLFTPVQTVDVFPIGLAVLAVTGTVQDSLSVANEYRDILLRNQGNGIIKIKEER